MSQSNEGSVVSMRLNVGSRKPMKEVDSARVITGQGIEGDRHLKEDGSRSRRQILLMDRETLGDFSLDDGIIRENITVVGMDFASLEAGDRVSIGEDVVLEITGECEPCARMDVIRSGLRHELDGRRGMLAYAENGGLISVGDVISVK